MRVISKSKNMRIISLLLIMVVALALHPTVNASAVAKFKRFPATTGNNAGVTMQTPNIVLYRGEFLFTFSGASSNATITSIVISLGTPTTGGATVIPNNWVVQRVTGTTSGQTSSVNVLPGQVESPINTFNGQNPNGLYSISFDADVFGSGVGMRSYPKMTVTVNYDE